MRLVDADALKDALRKEQRWVIKRDGYHNEGFSYDQVMLVIDKQPTIETEPVKHGRWIWNKRLGEWYCSNCDRIMTPYTVEKSDGEYEMAQPFYCGWCGARMDEVEE